MKIGKLSFGSGNNVVVAENIELENLKDLNNIIRLIADEARFVSSTCAYERVCTDYPDKCKNCYNRPNQSHFAKQPIARYAPPAPTLKEDARTEK